MLRGSKFSSQQGRDSDCTSKPNQRSDRTPNKNTGYLILLSSQRGDLPTLLIWSVVNVFRVLNGCVAFVTCLRSRKTQTTVLVIVKRVGLKTEVDVSEETCETKCL